MNHKIKAVLLTNPVFFEVASSGKALNVTTTNGLKSHFASYQSAKRWQSASALAASIDTQPAATERVFVEKHPALIYINSTTSHASTSTRQAIWAETATNLDQKDKVAIIKLTKTTSPLERIMRPRLDELRVKLKQDQNVDDATVPTVQHSSATSTSTIKQSISTKNASTSDQFTNNTKGCGVTASHDSTESIEQNLQAMEILLKKLRRGQQEQLNNKSLLLLDKYNRQHTYLRISLSERCNLRCQYCMPLEGVPLQPSSSLLSTLEIYKLVGIFASMGVNKVRLTGGEPLLRPDIVDIVSHISLNFPSIQSVGMTTNGITLVRHLPNLVNAGLTHVNISLDTLHEDKFIEITRRKGLLKVTNSIRSACEHLPPTAGTTGRVKVNCVVMKGFNDDELRHFIMLSKDLPLDIRFIEWMPFNDNGWSANRFFSYQSMLERITSDNYDELLPDHERQQTASYQDCYVPPIQLERIEDSPNDTTKWYNVPGHLGRVGFITSMSEQFCSTCNRIRLTADGKLKVCLFGSEEVSLRDALRAGISNDDLELLIGAAVKRKNYALGGHSDMHGIKNANNNRPMILIGG